MKLDLSTVATMTKSEAITLMDEAAREGDASAFWLLAGILTARLGPSSPLAEDLWAEAHSENPNVERAMRLIRESFI